MTFFRIIAKDLPQGHDSSSQGDTRDGVKVGKKRKDKVNGAEDYDEVCSLDGLAGWTN